jgi:hypothetical protein
MSLDPNRKWLPRTLKKSIGRSVTDTLDCKRTDICFPPGLRETFR